MLAWSSLRRASLAAAGALLMSAAAMPAAAQALEKVSVALPLKSLIVGPLFYAQDTGIFKRNGLDVELIVLRGSPPAAASLLSGETEFLVGADYEFLKLADTGRVVRIHTFTSSMVLNLTVANAVIEARGITDEMPVKERIARLKGITMGTISLGGATENYSRWLFRYAGLDPRADVEMLSVGGLPQLVGSLQAGRIDALLLSPPAGEVAERLGAGRNLVTYDEIPEFKGDPFLGMDTRVDFIEKSPETVRAMVLATVEAQREIVKDPKAAAAVLKAGSFSQNEIAELEKALTSMAPAFEPKPMSMEAFQQTLSLMEQVGEDKLANVKLEEDVNWTNRFFPKQ